VTAPSSASRGGGRPPGPATTGSPTAAVEELLRAFTKGARARQLYLPNNPIYRGAIDTLRAAFRPVWQQMSILPLTIDESSMQWEEETVFTDPTGAKTADNLAWLFYKDGVRELTITPGFEDEEVVKLLDIVQKARRATADDDDLVAMLWEAEFACLTYRHLDLLQEGVAGTETSSGPAVTPLAADEMRRETQAAVEESRAGGIVSMADFDSTLYFLDEEEVGYLRREIDREYAHDLRGNVIAALLDIFELHADTPARGEILEHAQVLLPHLLAAGHFGGVAYLLREVHASLTRTADIAEIHKNGLAQIADQLSAPDSLNQLLQALDEAPQLPAEDQLADLFAQLRPAALETIFQWLGTSSNAQLRPALGAAADRLAGENTSELVRLIQSPNRVVSDEAIRRAGSLKTQAAVLALSKLLSDPDASRRLAAVQALVEIGSAGALQGIERATEDADREVRIAVARAFALRGHRPALVRIEAAVKGRNIREADLTEKMAFFEAYGALAGDAGVELCDSILNGKSFLGRREDSEIRACAAVALGRIATARAMESLRKASGEKDVIVRSAVTRALRTPGATT
jgi:HEAT repeat protein